jgi:hypothetical protein
MQNYDLIKADQYVAIQGHQTLSFSFNTTQLQQRIDRYFIPSGGSTSLFLGTCSPSKISDYWIWGTGALDPIDYSLVVKSGDNGFACFVRGNNEIFLPPDLVGGYTDGECFYSLHFPISLLLMAPQLLWLSIWLPSATCFRRNFSYWYAHPSLVGKLQANNQQIRSNNAYKSTSIALREGIELPAGMYRNTTFIVTNLTDRMF